MSKAKLTFKQQAFVDAYSGNATEAARIAGYKGNEKQLAVVGSENLRKLNIVNAIKARQDKPRKAKILTREQRQELWSKFASDEEVSISDRLAAMRDLGKSEGDFFDRLKIEGGLSITTKDERELEDMMNELTDLIASLKNAVMDDPAKGE